MMRIEYLKLLTVSAVQSQSKGMSGIVWLCGCMIIFTEHQELSASEAYHGSVTLGILYISMHHMRRLEMVQHQLNYGIN